MVKTKRKKRIIWRLKGSGRPKLTLVKKRETIANNRLIKYNNAAPIRDRRIRAARRLGRYNALAPPPPAAAPPAPPAPPADQDDGHNDNDNDNGNDNGNGNDQDDDAMPPLAPLPPLAPIPINNSIYCGNTRIRTVQQGLRQMGTRKTCRRKGYRMGRYQLPADIEYARPYLPIDNRVIYCGNGAVAPAGQILGKLPWCLNKGIGAGKRRKALATFGPQP
jgi:hypothetical protein